MLSEDDFEARENGRRREEKGRGTNESPLAQQSNNNITRRKRNAREKGIKVLILFQPYFLASKDEMELVKLQFGSAGHE